MAEAKFSYSYSAKTQRELESIRDRYVPREESKLERLRRLDGSVQSAGIIESLCIGVVGCLIFGVGMCIGLGALAGEMWMAIVLGVLGVAVMLPAYPIYRMIFKRTSDRLAPEIIKLTDELMGESAQNADNSENNQ